MTNLPDKLHIWLVAKDMSVRARLREALSNVLFRPVIRGFASVKELNDPMGPDDAPAMIIVALSLGREVIAQIAARFKAAPNNPARVIVAIDGRGNLESATVVGLYLDGIDGFVSEP